MWKSILRNREMVGNLAFKLELTISQCLAEIQQIFTVMGLFNIE